MSVTVHNLLEEALLLSPASRASLAEKIVESIEADIDPEIEQAHLKEIRQRRKEVSSGRIQLVSGKEALQHARKVIRK